MEIHPLIDSYALHYTTFAGNVYTLATAGITLTDGTLTANSITDGTATLTGGNLSGADLDISAGTGTITCGPITATATELSDIGVWGSSFDSFGVYGFSTLSDAGHFAGTLVATGQATLGSILTTGDITLDSDSKKLYLGGTQEASIHHSGAHLYIDNNKGSTYYTVEAGESHIFDTFIEIPTTAATAGTATAGVITQNGTRVFHSYGTSNLFVGAGAGNFTTTGTGLNVGIGSTALVSLTDGNYNVAVGATALDNVAGGDRNFGLGFGAFNSISSQTDNVGVGFLAGDKSTGYQNLAIGSQALRNHTGGNENVAIGFTSMLGVNGTSTGAANTCIGSRSGYSLTSGASNLFLGKHSGYYQTTLADGLLIDNEDREDLPTELTASLVYGLFENHANGPWLSVNGDFAVKGTSYFGDGGDDTGARNGGATNYTTISATGDLTFVGTAGLVFGSCSCYDIGWTQVAAEDIWYNISDAAFIDGQLNNVTHDENGKLTVLKAGVYKVNVSIDWEVNAANKHIEVGFEISGSESAATEGIVCSEGKFANEEEGISTTALLDLAANATIEVCVRTTDVGTPTLKVNCVSLNCVQIGGT